MPREDDTYRAARYGGHPPYCTCVDCTRRRLSKQERRRSLKPVVIAVVAVAVIAVVVWALLSG